MSYLLIMFTQEVQKFGEEAVENRKGSSCPGR